MATVPGCVVFSRAAHPHTGSHLKSGVSSGRDFGKADEETALRLCVYKNISKLPTFGPLHFSVLREAS